MLAVPLAGLAGWTDSAYRALWERERCQVAVDNSLIRAGSADRALFDWLAKVSRELRRLHRVHHVWHACARVPATAGQCASADVGIERAIDSLARGTLGAARVRWLSTSAGFARDWRRWNEDLGPPIIGTVHRSPRLPARTVHCSRCGLISGWEVQVAQARTRVAVSTFSEMHEARDLTEGAIEWIVRDEHLQYRLAR